jgi:hypothetical protein
VIYTGQLVLLGSEMWEVMMGYVCSWDGSNKECAYDIWTMCVAGMGATRNVLMICGRRDMQKAYGDDMWVGNLRCNFYNMCDTRCT